MNDEIDIIHQDPLTLATAFDRVGIGAKVALETNLDFIGDRYILTVTETGADEKVVGQAALGWVERENANILRLLFLASSCRDSQKLLNLCFLDACHGPPCATSMVAQEDPKRRPISLRFHRDDGHECSSEWNQAAGQRNPNQPLGARGCRWRSQVHAHPQAGGLGIADQTLDSGFVTAVTRRRGGLQQSIPQAEAGCPETSSDADPETHRRLR